MCPTLGREQQISTQTPKPRERAALACQVSACQRVALRVDACPHSHPLGFSKPQDLSGRPAGAPVLTDGSMGRRLRLRSCASLAARVCQGHALHEVPVREHDSGDAEAGAFECPGSVRAAASRPALCVKGPRCGSGCLSPRLLGVQTPATSSSVSADGRSQLRSRDTKQTEVPLTLTSLGRRERVSFRAPRTALSVWEAQ